MKIKKHVTTVVLNSIGAEHKVLANYNGVIVIGRGTSVEHWLSICSRVVGTLLYCGLLYCMYVIVSNTRDRRLPAKLYCS